MNSRKRVTGALVGLIALVVVGWIAKDLASGHSSKPAPTAGASAVASSGASAGSNKWPTQSLSSLPPEAAATWKLIEKNGPFPYPRNDGVVFDNREKRLPVKPGEYYHEYTVPTPNSPDRGARRFITGSQHEVFYTGDHYSTFANVDVTK
ncbi:ribonuclease N [Solihabitans fulvus]|uniref:Ribonuclease N n=1 Tax=Solihabitans fulvus TaxID=1892852 RepID=A0A5B2XTE1_9PSEU|nr:ribonuclease domain-containing protein [Solihabitans fulvus]KAA2266091.1 ribonuclease N [Solihabitans fulvus]